jgi:hypothetical protein
MKKRMAEDTKSRSAQHNSKLALFATHHVAPLSVIANDE